MSPETAQLLKRAAAQAALDDVARTLSPDSVLGIGSGSTVNAFIALLAQLPFKLRGAVAASSASEANLAKVGVPVLDLNDVTGLTHYVDGADEIGPGLALIKGGGAALTREKIIAQASTRFICIADATKVVPFLGNFPLPIEVVAMARQSVVRQVQQLGGEPRVRSGVLTDNGHPLIDVSGLHIDRPAELEATLNNIPGVVTNGLFALRPADIAYVARLGANGQPAIDTLS